MHDAVPPRREALPPTHFEHSLLIRCAPTRVMARSSIRRRSRCGGRRSGRSRRPRPLGVYAVEWAPTDRADDLLGRLGGVFHGTVMEYLPGRELFVADAWWLPPDGEPIGPMALEVSCMIEGASCRLRVHQTGFEDSPRWRRYYAVIARGWQSSLGALKTHLER